MRNKNLRSPSLVARIRSSGWTWQSGGAVFGLLFGIISPLVGGAFTAVSWFTGPEWHGFLVQRYGTVLLVLTIPLLLLGAHCLDLMDKKDDEASKGDQVVQRSSGPEEISEEDRIQMAVAQETVLRLLR